MVPWWKCECTYVHVRVWKCMEMNMRMSICIDWHRCVFHILHMYLLSTVCVFCSCQDIVCRRFSKHDNLISLRLNSCIQRCKIPSSFPEQTSSSSLLPKIHHINQNLRILQVTLSRDFYLDTRIRSMIVLQVLHHLAPFYTKFVKLTAQTCLVFSKVETWDCSLMFAAKSSRSSQHFSFPTLPIKKNRVWARQMLRKKISA